MAAVTAECKSESVEATTRAANVEALNSMLGVHNQRDFQSANGDWAGIATPEHSQQIFGQRIVAVRRDRLFALHQSMAGRQDHRHLGQQPLGLAEIGIVVV